MSTAKPIDLKSLCGQTYRIQHDPASIHEPGGRKDPWLYVIPCRRGHIYPHSASKLALWWESTARMDFRYPFLTLCQDGDEEKTYLFNPEDLPKAAGLAGARRRRRLSRMQREAATLRLQPFQKTRRARGGGGSDDSHVAEYGT